tara:strand:+ start:919 stop:1479 length:561 start_codon:yes stop_codon:yes gene_type:complete
MSYELLNIDYDPYLALQCIQDQNFTIEEQEDDHFIDYARINDKELKTYIRQLLDLPFPIEVLFFVNPPHGVYNPHIDLQRKCAINFPVNVAGDLYTAKDAEHSYWEENKILGEDEINYPPIDDSNRHMYEHVHFMKHPILLDTSKPHSAANNTKISRFIITCSIFTHTFDQVKDILQEKNMIINTV